MELTDLTFEQWLRHVFDHELQEPQWYFQMGTEYWSGPTRVTLRYLTRLFNDPVKAVQGYSDAQVDQGLWYLISSAASNIYQVLWRVAGLICRSVRWSCKE